MEIKVTLVTPNGNVITSFKPSQIDLALELIRSYVASGYCFNVFHQPAWN